LSKIIGNNLRAGVERQHGINKGRRQTATILIGQQGRADWPGRIVEVGGAPLGAEVRSGRLKPPIAPLGIRPSAMPRVCGP
jgi:hypothetical protein